MPAERAAPEAGPQATLLALQAKAGNRAVQRLVTAVQRAGTLDADDEATLEAALEANGAANPENDLDTDDDETAEGESETSENSGGTDNEEWHDEG